VISSSRWEEGDDSRCVGPAVAARVCHLLLGFGTSIVTTRMSATAAGPGSHVYLDGAVGIDTLALNWLAEDTPAAPTLVVPCTLADQPDQARRSVPDTARRAEHVSLRSRHLADALAHLGVPARWIRELRDLVLHSTSAERDQLLALSAAAPAVCRCVDGARTPP